MLLSNTRVICNSNRALRGVALRQVLDVTFHLEVSADDERLRPMLGEQLTCLQHDVLPALKAHGIEVRHYAELSEDERHALNLYFIEHVFPVLTPQAVDPAHPFPYISSLSLNLGVMIEAGAKAD